MEDLKLQGYLKAGKKLASPAPGDEVVITGMAGRFPESENIYELWDNLINNIDMVTLDDRRWDITKPGIPHRSGKIGFLEKFDAGFFDIGYREANAMDPQCKHLLERAVEAVFDAGYNLKQIRGSKTGVIVSSLYTETERYWYYDHLESKNNAITGCTRSMQAQRISRALRLKGPTFSIDTGSSSSGYAIEHGYRAIRTGQCDNVLVCSSHLCLQPKLTYQYFQLGALSADGKCKCFDESADGLVRSEAVTVILLQKAKNAKRIYGQLVHIKTNVDGYKEKGQTYPSADMQKQLINEVYEECNIDPSTIDYLESHATGTKVGDPQEIIATGQIFCKNRTEPLPTGSLKSNIGHVEPASAMCSLIKILMSMENEVIPANLHFKQVKRGLEAIESGKMVVVTKNLPWPKNGTKLVALNNMGIGGANAHAVIRHHSKQKFNKGLPKDDLPRLVCVSGRTEASINHILNDICNRSLDQEFMRLIQEVFEYNIDGHLYRGYAVVSKSGPIDKAIQNLNSTIRQPLCLFFGDFDKNGLKNFQQLFEMPHFKGAFQRINQVLQTLKFDLPKVLKTDLRGDLPINVIMTSFAVQMALVEVFKALQLDLQYLSGHSFGQIVAAYYDDALTFEQAILTAYCFAQNLPMDKTAFAEEQSKAQVIDFNYNLSNGFHLNGSHVNDHQFNESHVNGSNVNGSNVNGSHVNGSNSNYDARKSYILKQLNQIIPNPKEFSSRWLTDLKERHVYASSSYFIDQLLSPDQAKTIYKVPSNVLLVKIGSESFSEENDRGANLSNISTASFLNILGRIYNLGFNPKIAKLYPEVQWPVSAKTPMISPLIKWNYSIDWFVPRFSFHQTKKPGEQKFQFSAKATNWAFLTGHVIDGRNLVPATAYLYIAWETFSLELGLPMFEMNIIFKDVRFVRATNISKNSDIELTVTVQKNSGRFEVLRKDQLVACGFIGLSDSKLSEIQAPPDDQNDRLELTTQDIYKELSLRGYNYSGEFHNIQSCNMDRTKSSIKWNSNWIAFIDNMLQVKVFQTYSRNLVVPTLIEEVVIHAPDHVKYAEQFGENVVLPVYLNNDTGYFRSGGIEIKGFSTTSISRKKNPHEPILQTFAFIPLNFELATSEVTRVVAQMLQENSNSTKLKIVEIYEDSSREPLSPLLQDSFAEILLTQAEITVYSQIDKEIPEVTVLKEPFNFKNITSCTLIVASKILSKLKSRPVMKDVLSAINENGAVLSREGRDFDQTTFEISSNDICVLSVYQTETEKLVLFRQKRQLSKQTIIDVSEASKSFEWIPKLQGSIKNKEHILLVSKNKNNNGILGLQKSLKCEPGTGNIKLVFVMDRAPKFDLENKFYSKQLEKGLIVNVFQNGTWGTYRYLPMEPLRHIKTEHVVNEVMVKGDLSSFRWVEGGLTSKSFLPSNKELVYIHAAGLNFRDVMAVLGRVNEDVVIKNRLLQHNIQGSEFAGRTTKGKRVMGIASGGAISSMISVYKHSIWEIPNSLSFEEAATIPLVYATVLYALIVTAKIKQGQSILIHAGSGATGQAAINIASYFNCNIFTTVGAVEKKNFLLKHFPQIPENQIGKSRDCSFEQMVNNVTNGRGVDIVLNSLIGEKQEASVRCLADGGSYLELQKFDLIKNYNLITSIFNRGCSFSGIMIDSIHANNPAAMCVISDLIKEGFEKGYIKPLNKTVFAIDQVEKAYRYLAGAQHIGKVVIKIRDLNGQPQLYDGLAKLHCNPENSYIITGGLGGFGVELADWLVLRGARKLILVSRSGIHNGYQGSMVNNWEKHGVKVSVTTANTITEQGCTELLKQANALGPVDAIFHLAVVMQDHLFENQTEETFKLSLGAKAIALENLDKLSRKLCTQLRYFVAFSSMCCGYGYAGQTNYTMANSITERICEKRKREGYPAVAIQWGSIGDVGMVAEAQSTQIKSEIGGSRQQPLASCLKLLDLMLKQDAPVVSSMIIAEKVNNAVSSSNLVDAVRVIMGLKSLKGISMQASFPQLGMDSIMAVEIRQTLEHEYNVFLTAPQIRSMTYEKLQKIMKTGSKIADTKKPEVRKYQNLNNFYDFPLLLTVAVKSKNAYIPFLKLKNNVEAKPNAPTAYFLPGIDGQAMRFEPLAEKLNYHTYSLQLPYSDALESSIEDIASTLIPRLQEQLTKSKPFTLISYSFGCVVAVETVHLLEAQGYTGNLILIDGAPSMFKDLIRSYLPEGVSKDKMETPLLAAIMKLYVPLKTVLSNLEAIDACTSLEERVNFVVNSIQEHENHSRNDLKNMCASLYARLHALATYAPNYAQLKSKVTLIKPTQPIHPTFDHDYKVQEICEKEAEVIVYDGNHMNITENPQTANCINSLSRN